MTDSVNDTVALQEEIQRLRNQLARLESQAAQQRLLTEVMTELTASIDLPSRMNQLARLVVPRMADLCAIYSVSNGSKLEALAVAHSEPQREAWAYEEMSLYPIQLNGRHPVAEAIRISRPVRHETVDEDVLRTMANNTAHLEFLRSLDLSSMMSIPLIARGYTIGVLHLVTDGSGRHFSAQDEALAVDLARRASLVLDNARLYDRQQSTRQTLEQAINRLSRLQRMTAILSEEMAFAKIVRIIIEQGVSALGTDAGSVLILSEDGQSLRQLESSGYMEEVTAPWSEFPLSEPLPISDTVRIGQAIWLSSLDQTRAEYPLLLEADPQHQAWATLPLKREGRPIGGMVLSFRQPQEFLVADRSFMQAIAYQCELALERAHRYESEQRARATAELLAARAARVQLVTEALSAALSPSQVIGIIADQGIAALGARAGLVFLYDPEEQALQLAGGFGYNDEVHEHWQHIPLRANVPVAKAARTGMPNWLETFEERSAQFPGVGDHPDFANDGAWATLPLWSNERIIGALGLTFSAARKFTGEERVFILTLAQQCAQALDRARLYQIEQQARTAAEAAIRERDQVVSLISHDLKSPLSAIQGYTQLLLRRVDQVNLPDAERWRRGLNSIALSTSRVASQIEELLDVASLQSGRVLTLDMKPIDIVPLIQAVVESSRMISTRHALVVETKLPAIICNVDTIRLERVISNLVTNAVKYSPEGGVVRLVIDHEMINGQWCVVIHVSDQGIGIPEEDLPTIFEPFKRGSNVRGEFSGTGLGLASARQIIEQHGGTISVTSVLSRGTIFTIWLPQIDESILQANKHTDTA
ncbi:MAG: GAF domain-containing protein [Chloroflexaceae bacterium]|nr:GAF domain-containing protein [Chloroflexaceae bacterium]